MLSGDSHTFPTVDSRYQKHGKCGYCAFSSGTFNEYRNYRRAILQSYSCNDGEWRFNWYSDNEAALSCDEEEDSWCHFWQSEEDYPSELFLGYCEKRDKTFNYSNLVDDASSIGGGFAANVGN